ncbi:MAG: M23 family metallopeptidase [Candidatus Cryptobacteroides sp.]
MSHLYKIGSDFLFKESDKPWQRVLRFIGTAALCALALALLLYGVFALAINTDTEGRLKRENKMYEKLYPQLLPSQELLDDAVSGLELKDGEIYSEVFHSNAPSVDPIQTLTPVYADDTIKNTSLIAYASAKSDSMYLKMFSVEADLVQALQRVAGENVSLPPMHLPLAEISFTQLGASIGMKTNPVLKARVRHNGLDIIVPTGTPVLAAGDGRVSKVEKSNKGFGNTVTITHSSSYVTRYAHLSTISVRQGQKVKAGQKIGAAGMSGSSFAPHLHYEIIKDGEYQDPVNYFFASVGVEEYANMLYIATNTEQSMD